MADTTSDELVVTATPTIMDGYVVRWYDDLNAAANGHEMMSASRNGVRIRCYLHEVPQEALNAATGIAARLKVASERVFGGDHSADEAARALATHHRRGFGRHSQLEPISPETVDRWIADHAHATAAATWHEIAKAHPEFVQWAAQRHGGLPDGPVRQDDYDRLAAEYAAEAVSRG